MSTIAKPWKYSNWQGVIVVGILFFLGGLGLSGGAVVTASEPVKHAGTYEFIYQPSGDARMDHVFRTQDKKFRYEKRIRNSSDIPDRIMADVYITSDGKSIIDEAGSSGPFMAYLLYMAPLIIIGFVMIAMGTLFIFLSLWARKKQKISIAYYAKQNAVGNMYSASQNKWKRGI